MPGVGRFLRCVGKATLQNSGKAIASLVPFGEAAFEIVRDAWANYRKEGTPLPRRDQQRPVGPTRIIEEADVSPGDLPLVLISSQDQGKRQAGDDHSDMPVIVKGREHSYALLGLLAEGDVADVQLAGTTGDPPASTEGRYDLKMSRGREGNDRLDNERRVLTRLLSGARDTAYRKHLPALVESFTAADRSGERVNVFQHEPGLHTLEQVHARHPALDGRHLAWIFKRLLAVLGFAHAGGFVHGAVLPCHILLDAAGHGLRLIGWGQSAEIGARIEAISTRYRDWYPPEVRRKQPAAPATDLFLAAGCLTYLAGGDIPLGRMPESVPAPLRRFIETCLLDGPRMRPNDAWRLHDEFDELLRRVYGSPKFHPLDMT